MSHAVSVRPVSVTAFYAFVRSQRAWVDPPAPLRGVAAVLDLPEWGLHIPLADLYAGLRFRMRPALLWPDKEGADTPGGSGAQL